MFVMNSADIHSETIKRILSLPADTVIVWKSHDDSIAQRSAIDQARNDKGVVEKRRPNENIASAKEKVEA
jgi:translation initiation factor 4E